MSKKWQKNLKDTKLREALVTTTCSDLCGIQKRKIAKPYCSKQKQQTQFVCNIFGQGPFPCVN